MIQVGNFKAVWVPEQQSIRFSWDMDALQDSVYVHIFGISDDSGRSQLNSREHQTVNLLDMHVSGQSGVVIRYNAQGQVGAIRKRFCAFADTSLDVNPAELSKALDAGELASADVIIGYSEVSFSIKDAKVGAAKICSITLDCSASVAPGVLSYTYSCEDLKILYPIMQPLEKGKNRLPPIAIPSECSLQLVTVGGSIKLQESRGFKLFK